MTTLKHPTIPGLTHDVPDADVPEWVASGWVAPEVAIEAAHGPEIVDFDGSEQVYTKRSARRSLKTDD